jgi:hypothetical protein
VGAGAGGAGGAGSSSSSQALLSGPLPAVDSSMPQEQARAGVRAMTVRELKAWLDGQGERTGARLGDGVMSDVMPNHAKAVGQQARREPSAAGEKATQP